MNLRLVRTFPDSANCCTPVAPPWRWHPSQTAVAAAAAAATLTYRAHSVELYDDNGQWSEFAKGMIRSIRGRPSSFSLSLSLYQRRRNQSISALRRLQARFSTTVFSLDTHELVSRHGFRDGAGGASATGRRK